MSVINRQGSGSTVRCMPMETLKGVFGPAKMTTHRRDFLRENKLNVKELQRMTCKKQQDIIQQQQQQWQWQWQQKQQQQLQQQQQQQTQPQLPVQNYTRRRSVSQQRMTPTTAAVEMGTPRHGVTARYSTTQKPSNHRMLSQQEQSNNEQTGGGGSRRQRSEDDENSSRWNGSNITSVSKISHDKQIQTEDINDEAFLYNALKKCTSDYSIGGGGGGIEGGNGGITTNVQSARSHNGCNGFANDGIDNEFHQQQQYPRYLELPLNGDTNNVDEDEHVAEQRNHNVYDTNMRQHVGVAPSSHRSVRVGTTSKPSYHNDELLAPQNSTRSHVVATDTNFIPNDSEELNANMNNLLLNGQCDSASVVPSIGGGSHVSRSRLGRTEMSQQQHDDTASVLSKKTSLSNMSKQLGNRSDRDDLRLPRYLEREKREKAHQRMRELERDPHCPLGHYSLSEEQRLQLLKTSQERYESLVQELNRMPMTMETLRIRTRKGEIEKELISLEADVRVYSKPKVYVRQPDH